MKRLRVIDVACKWFWLVAFYRKQYAKPIFQISLYSGVDWCQGWIHILQWEDEPANIPQGVEEKKPEYDVVEGAFPR